MISNNLGHRLLSLENGNEQNLPCRHVSHVNISVLLLSIGIPVATFFVLYILYLSYLSDPTFHVIASICSSFPLSSQYY